MKIYTKKGDSGTTQLLGGKRVSKNHERIEAYGTIDELNSYIGLIRDHDIDENLYEFLIEIQDRLFTIGSLLAVDNPDIKFKLPRLSEIDVEDLEKKIDLLEKNFDEMKSFVLPGGNKLVSFCHIARCVCRRAERIATTLPEETIQFKLILKYLNRLSDFLFVLSRYFSKKMNAKEVPWKPKV
ncbi:MAG: cob(I)yrinic acid a,c-diamide adenosyltransferase [Flavobacteriales bacterium]